MKNLILTTVLAVFTNLTFVLAQEQMQVRRIINCVDKGGFTQINITTDSPNQRFVPMERELQRYLMTWGYNGKLPVYHYSEKMADFSKEMTKQEFRQKLVYFDKFFGDSIELRPIDLFEFGLEENVTYENGKFSYDIQALLLYIPKGVIGQELKSRKAIARFRYKDLAKLWTETYEKSLKTKIYGGLDCFVQVYHDNTQTISFTEALEKRYFNSSIETVIPANKKAILEKEEEYKEKVAKQEGIVYLPQFTQIENNKIVSSIIEIVDLKKEKEFYKEDNTLVKILIEGVRNGELQPYFFMASPRYVQNFSEYKYNNYVKDYKMSKQDFEKKMRSYTYKVDSIKPKPHQVYIKRVPIDSTNLKIKDISMLAIQSIVEVEKGKNINFRPYKITLILPKGTNQDTKFGNMRLFSFEYKEVAKYLEKMTKKSEKYTLQIQNQGKMSFAEAIEKRLFSSNILYKYDNFSDQYLLSILHDKYEGKIDDVPKRRKEESEVVLKYFYSLTK